MEKSLVILTQRSAVIQKPFASPMDGFMRVCERLLDDRPCWLLTFRAGIPLVDLVITNFKRYIIRMDFEKTRSAISDQSRDIDAVGFRRTLLVNMEENRKETSMKNLTRFKFLFIIPLLVSYQATAADSIQCSKATGCVCPDMREYSGKLPEGWHTRFDQEIKSDPSNSLQVVILEQIDKKGRNNFYCRYINDQGKSFVLSTLVPANKIIYTNKQFWQHDEADYLWECHPTDKTGKLNNSQCAFTF